MAVMRIFTPASLGLAVAVAVAAFGLAVSAPGPDQAVDGGGVAPIAPERPQPAEQRQPREAWTPPELPTDEELQEMPYEEYLETLQTQIDPRGPESEQSAGMIVIDEGPVIRFGQSGWDSSHYPQVPPVSIPAGFQLYRAEDGGSHVGDRDREWAYWRAPQEGAARDVCRELVRMLPQQGFQIQSGGECESFVPQAMPGESERYVIISRQEDGTWLEATVSGSSAPCLNREGGQCQQLLLVLQKP